MNNKGFTLIEVLLVVVLLGLIIGIAVPGVMRANKRTKEKSLVSKIDSIESAAILFGQEIENNSKYTIMYSDETDYCLVCKDKVNCYCLNYEITVQDLLDKEMLEAEEDGNIYNPTEKSKTLNNCSITIYKKYGKIYATYNNKVRGNECWVN